MSKFKKNLITLLSVIAALSAIIVILSAVIFIFDITESKGLLPLIFFCIFLYFISLFLIDLLDKNLNKNLRIDIVKLFFMVITLATFILSLYVFWI